MTLSTYFTLYLQRIGVGVGASLLRPGNPRGGGAGGGRGRGAQLVHWCAAKNNKDFLLFSSSIRPLSLSPVFPTFILKSGFCHAGMRRV